ncbi:sigma-70 family RNA polymerase sigma factor [Paenibacillus sp. HB172176]|uniref:RNA polymerase sigma factor n=1 Tax=Paenibacillus sp. HB172176 TaxID=2493690 RepID=UPI001F104D77|nr:sigma-70 family RNA polymerase sigma factor [Paenibacillus sp. HB172176]
MRLRKPGRERFAKRRRTDEGLAGEMRGERRSGDERRMNAATCSGSAKGDDVAAASIRADEGKDEPAGVDTASLLRETLLGSEEAFRVFYARCAPLVLRIAIRMLEDKMEAEDVCHDVLLEAIRGGDKYKEERGSVEAWLAIMAKSRCLDRLRRRQKQSVVDLSREGLQEGRRGHVATPEESVIASSERRIVREALGALPSAQRNAVAAAYFEDKTQRQMAEDWQVPLGTVKSWIRYGLNNMRKELAKRGWSGAERGEDDGDRSR